MRECLNECVYEWQIEIALLELFNGFFFFFGNKQRFISGWQTYEHFEKHMK